MISTFIWYALQFAHAQTFIEVQHRALRTTVMRRASGLVDPDAAGALVLFGGTGAKSKSFGIKASMEPIAYKALKLGFSPVAYQNPIYLDDHLSDEERFEAVGPYRTTNHQVNWLNDCVSEVTAELAPAQRLILAGRSTGSALLLESLHRYLRDGAYADQFSRVEHLLIMGPVDSRPAEWRRWFEVEYAYLSAQTNLFDRFAYDATPDLFGDMKHARQPARRVGARVPDVTFIAGAHDALSTLGEQIAFARVFQQLHPQVGVRVIAMDTSHNPAASLDYVGRDGRQVKAGVMKRLSPILKQLITAPKRLAPGFDVDLRPELEQVPNCQEQLAGAQDTVARSA